MKLTKVSIKNFRSFKNQIVFLLENNYLTFTGENNCGKSNVLRALNLFFNDKVDDEKFNSQIDMNKYSLENTPQERTNITCTLKIDVTKEKHIISRLEKLKSTKIIMNFNIDNIEISYVVTKNNIVLIQFVDPITKKRTQHEEIDDLFNNAIRKSVDFMYIPAIKDLRNFIDKDMSYEILKRVFNKWGTSRKVVNQRIDNKFETIKRAIGKVISLSEDNLTSIIQEQDKSINKIILNLPFKDIVDFLSNLPISLDDGVVTDILQKGSGIQTMSLYAILRFLVRYQPFNKYASASYIWAIEEPETFLHPKAQQKLHEAFKNYSETTQILMTTHSYYFLNTQNIKCNYLLSKNKVKDTHLNKTFYETAIINNDKELWKPFIEILGDYKPSFIPSENAKYYFFVEGTREINYISKTIELYPDLKVLFKDVLIMDGNGSEITRKADEAKNIFSVKTIVLVDGDPDGLKYFNALKNKNFVENKSLYKVSAGRIKNPTIEALVCKAKLNDFKQTMPINAQDFWFGNNNSVRKVDAILNSDEKCPTGWDKDGFKKKLCEYMILNGTLNDYSKLYLLLKKIGLNAEGI